MATSGRSQPVTWAELDVSLATLEARIEAKIELAFARLETLIERATVTNIRWTVGLTFGLYALILGLMLFVVSRELPRP